MATLDEKQFELDGVVFGLSAPVGLVNDGWDPGSPTRRTSSDELPGADGVRFGKDYNGSATWAFSLFTDGKDESEAWDRAAELGSAWSGDDIRTTSELVTPLRYRLNGQTRRVYGRPQRWTVKPNNFSLLGRIDITCDFEISDPLIYDDMEESVEIGMSAPLDPQAGFIPPFIPPVTLGAGQAQRVGQVTVGGDRPTPVWVRFVGPVAGAKLQTSLWTCQLLDDVANEDAVVVDARPWVRSATRESGGGVRVNPRVTRIARMFLPPGSHDLTFTGTDPTGTAKAVVSWRNAWRSPR